MYNNGDLLKKILLYTFMILALIGCGLEGEEEAGSSLFAGHKPVENAFVLNSMASKTYVDTETIQVKLTHPFVVTVTGGVPSLDIDLDGSIVSANYTAGSGTKVLTFEYTVMPGDDDLDGIKVGPLISLNGSTIQYTQNGTLTDAELSFATAAKKMPNVLVDTTVPVITSITPPLPDTYYETQNIFFAVTYDSIVNVSGTPKLVVNIGGVNTEFDYFSGSGSVNLLFRHTVSSGEVDLNGVDTISPLILSGGTIKDISNINASLAFVGSSIPFILVNGDTPWITSRAAPTNNTYIPGEKVQMSVTFNKSVTVTGVPRVSLDVGGITKYANYLSGNGTDTLIFEYSVLPGDVDTDGVEFASLIDMNGGAIDDGAGNNADPFFDTLYTSGVIIDGPIPTVTSITPPANGTYVEGDVLYFTLNFNMIVDVTGSPILESQLDSTNPTLTNMTYSSGSGTVGVIFRYVVTDADSDYTGLDFINSLNLNGGEIKNSNLTNADLDLTTALAGLDTTGVIIDGIDPFVVSITPPVDGTYSNGENLDFSVEFNEVVSVTGSPKMTVDIGGSSFDLTYAAGTGTNNLVFRYTLLGGEEDTDGINLTSAAISPGAGSIVDASANLANYDISSIVLNLSNVLVDAISPTITSITLPADTTYLEGQDLSLTVNFDENVIVTGSPRIAITLTSGTIYANYTSGSGSQNLIFTYTVLATDSDLDGISLVTPLDLNSGTLKDINTNDAELTYALPNTSGILVDGLDPFVSSITAPINATYLETNNLDFTLTFNEVVNVTGTPRLSLDIGGSSVFADYLSGSGTSDLVFRYTVASGLSDADGIELSSLIIDLNSGTISDISTNSAELDFSGQAPDLSAVLVDSTLATIANITLPANKTYISTENMDFIFEFSENVDILGPVRLAITLDSGTIYANYSSGTGTKFITFRHTVIASELDSDGILMVSPIDLNTGTVKDSATNDADLSFALPDTSGILVDAIVPSIIGVTVPTDATYIETNNLDFTLEFDEIVNVTGSPRIEITLASGSVYATYISGSGTTDLVFRYTVASNEEDSDGITLVTPVQLNGGTIKDTSLNNADLSYTLPVTSGILIDAVAAAIVNMTVPVNGTYDTTQTLTFIAEFSEIVNVVGVPRIQILLDSGNVYANYSAGTGTKFISFTYTIGLLDEDLDGVGMTSPVDLNLSTIKDSGGTNVNLAYVIPNTAGIIIGVEPTVTISFSPDIDNSNVAAYTYSGTCSEDGEDVDLLVGGSISKTITCSSGSWTSGSMNLTALSDGTITLLADHASNAGTNAVQASVDVTKTTSTPTVTINATGDINNSNETSFQVTGTCSENGRAVSVGIGALSFTPNCSGGTWSTGFVDVSSLSDGAVLLTADHDNAGAVSATQATLNINKDSGAPTVTISSAPDINASNETSYVLSGSCSESGRTVTVDIDGLGFTPTCTGSSTWSTGTIDVSSLSDGTNLLVTADHDNASAVSATQATDTINKASATPTISNLTAPTTLADAINLDWNLVAPGGYTINDYVVEYKASASPTWLSFSDGVSLNQYVTVTNLTADTSFDFRVAVIYDTSFQSDWSSTVTATTQPEDTIFGPNSAMNVGGATASVVTAHFDSTSITLNGSALTTLNKGQTHSFTSTIFDVIDADKPIYVAGKIGAGASAGSGNIVWNPTEWAGKSFSFNATRSNPQVLTVFAIEDTYIEVKQGSTVLDSATVTKGNGATLSWSVYGSYQINATGSILAYHYSNSGGNYTDPKPIMPGSNQMIGFPSSSMTLTASFDSTNYTFLHSNSVSGSGSLNKTTSTVISPEGTTSLYQSMSLLIDSDKSISGASFADSNGFCAAPFLPTGLMKKKYIVNVSSDYVAFASKTAGTIEVRDSSNTLIETLTLTRSGASTNAPYAARRGATPAGYRFISTVKVGGWYQPTTDTGGAAGDETILYGTND